MCRISRCFAYFNTYLRTYIRRRRLCFTRFGGKRDLDQRSRAVHASRESAITLLTLYATLLTLTIAIPTEPHVRLRFSRNTTNTLCATHSQTDKTATFDGGDLYTGQLDADGRRQGKGRCAYGAAVGTVAREETATALRRPSASGTGGGSGGSYVGEWDADEPHGHGERIYPHPREAEGKGREGRGVGDEVDMAIMSAAFGPECPPLASYRGEFKRGIRDGNGVCSFFAAGPGTTATSLGATRRPLAVPVPESYEGEWVDGRPMGKGVLTLRAATAAAAVATSAPSSGPYPSSVPGSGSTMTTTRDGTTTFGSSGGGSKSGSSSGSIEGVWTEEGLVHGREKLPGKGGVYEGQYRIGRREGHGRLELLDGSEYEGERHCSKVILVTGLVRASTEELVESSIRAAIKKNVVPLFIISTVGRIEHRQQHSAVENVVHTRHYQFSVHQPYVGSTRHNQYLQE